MTNITQEIKELKKKISELWDIDSDIHKGHWTKDDVTLAECQAKIQTWKTAIDGEIEFLEELKRQDVGDICELVNYRLSELKQAREMLG